ncbi:MAG: hypothetical protein JWN67_3626 [Actinomycetia bacterium]|nr:hypothetical protein [Actinomycetes bacterium]
MGRHAEPTHAEPTHAGWTPGQPDRRQAAQGYAFHLSMADAWARAMTPVWFLCLLGALFGISTETGRLPSYLLGAVSLLGTFGSTWLLSRRAFTWQYRRPYHWWSLKHHWQAHRAYRNFQAHFPVGRAWQVIFAGGRTLGPISGSRREDRPPR